MSGPDDERDDELAAAAARATAPRSTSCCDATRASCTRCAGASCDNPKTRSTRRKKRCIAIARRIETFDGRSQVHDVVLPRRDERGARRSPPRATAAPSRSRSLPEPPRRGRPVDETVADRSTSTPRSRSSRPSTAPRSRCATSSASTTPRSREVLGIPPGTVRSRIARGRAALADQLVAARSTGTRHPPPNIQPPEHHEPPRPTTDPEPLDELLSADLDGELDRAAAELGFTSRPPAPRSTLRPPLPLGATRSCGPATCSPRDLPRSTPDDAAGSSAALAAADAAPADVRNASCTRRRTGSARPGARSSASRPRLRSSPASLRCRPTTRARKSSSSDRREQRRRHHGAASGHPRPRRGGPVAFGSVTPPSAFATQSAAELAAAAGAPALGVSGRQERAITRRSSPRPPTA